MAYIGVDPNIGDITFQTFTGTGSATAFTLAQSVVSGEALLVTIGNVVQEPGTSKAYTAQGNTLTFSAAPANGDVITVRFFGRAVDQPTSYAMQLFKYVATNNQTAFTGADANGAILAFSGDDVDVYLNGVHLDSSDFTASNGDTITLGTGATTNDELVIRAYRAFTVTDTVSKASGGTFAGAVTVPQLNADNIRLDGNTISSTDTNGDITLDPNGTGDTIVSSGNVGIGTTPDSPLHVIGDGKFKSSGEVKIRFQNDTTGTGSSDGSFIGVFNGSDGMALYNYEATPMRFFTSNAERMRIDSSGNVLVNQSSSTTPGVGNTTAGFALNSGNLLCVSRSGDTAVSINRSSNDGSLVDLRKGGTTIGQLKVTDSDNLSIDCTSTNHAGLTFAANVILPRRGGAAADNVIALGSSGDRFDDAFVTNGVTTGSDENEKQQIASLTNAEMTAAKAISALFKTFKWNDAVAAKGDAARTHTGVMAQQVATALTDAGLDAGSYAFYMSDTWWETSTEVAAVEADEEAAIEAKDAYTRIDTYQTADEAPEGATKRTRLGVRYPELLAFVGAATEQRLGDIETRLAALEAGS